MLRYLAPAGCVPEVVVEVDAVALTAVVAVAVVVVVGGRNTNTCCLTP